MEHSKLCRRGVATWNVRCDTPPPAFAFPLTFGYQRYSMKIYDPKVTWNQKEVKSAEKELGSKSWIDALKGNHIKDKGEPAADDAEREERGEASREAWHEKPVRSNRTTPERPAKKIRHAGHEDGDGMQMDEDNDVVSIDDDADEEEDEQESARLSEEESLGFGTETEQDDREVPGATRRALSII
eukprot:5563720-Amphidinium_carterae.1